MTSHPFREFVHRRRRGAELFLLVLSLVVGIGAYAAVGLGAQDEIPTNIVNYGAWLTALVVAAHVTIRRFAPYADPVLLPIVSALNGLGLAMIHRLDLTDMPGVGGLAAKQLQWMTVGVVLFVAVLVLLKDHRRLQAFTYTSGLGAIVLLLLPILPVIGTNIRGARIWIQIGGFSFQPGEIAKIALVVFFAGYLVLHRDALALAGRRVAGIDLPRGRDLGPIVLMWAASMIVLVGQRDLGSSLLFFGLFVVMLYVATERAGWLFVGGAMFLVGAYAAYLATPHVKPRVDGWLDPFADPDAYGQIIQSMYGMAWGGLLGRGLGLGSPDRIPFAYSDFIMGAIGEELGLTGFMAVILLYGLIVERALRTALVCRDNFGKLIATGLGVVFALQVFVVVGGVTKLIPLTGLTTPFLSYGGSSLVANWVVVALLLRISDHARRPPPDLTPPDEDDATQVVMMK
ncbi:MAG TPA: FtsW/RodA/SpoVE family cell cycle protein [Nocardioidaceae bacterium]|nr:FtsW/RodA/SpoVE family cell cycle protein [Nocardioidaceae bacterium]